MAGIARFYRTAANAPSNAITFRTPPDESSLILKADYSTNNFSKWPSVQNKFINGNGSAYDALPPGYPAQVSTDATYGYAARFEVRTGDIPPFGGGERTEVAGSHNTGGQEGSTYWYEFATKFDASYPSGRSAMGWGLVNQWHAISEGTPPFGWYVDQVDENWSFVINRQSAPDIFLSNPVVLNLPLNRGLWQHITMCVTFSVSDSSGSVKIWLNGAPQTLTNGLTSYNARTLVPTSDVDQTVYYKEGIYRQPDIASTEVVYHTAFRCATNPDSFIVYPQ